MLKKLIILFFIIAPIGVYAQDKLAYINTQEVFMLMPELKDVETKLAAKQEEIKNKAAAFEKEYETKLADYQKLGDNVSQEKMAEFQTALQDIQTRYQGYLETSDGQFQELRQKELAPLQASLQKAIQEVGAEQGFTYIIEEGALPYVSTKAVNAAKFVKTKLGIK